MASGVEQKDFSRTSPCRPKEPAMAPTQIRSGVIGGSLYKRRCRSTICPITRANCAHQTGQIGMMISLFMAVACQCPGGRGFAVRQSSVKPTKRALPNAKAAVKTRCLCRALATAAHVAPPPHQGAQLCLKSIGKAARHCLFCVSRCGAAGGFLGG